MNLASTIFDHSVVSDHPLFSNLDRCVMTELQTQVLSSGTCPNCHTKRLSDGYKGGGMRFQHCRCGHTWVTPNPMVSGGGTPSA